MLCIPFRFAIQPLLQAAPTVRNLELPDINGLVNSYQHASSDKFGYESATLQYNATVADGIWLLTALGKLITVSDPYGADSWQGIIHSITIRANGVDHTISMEQLANRIRTRFTTALGTNGVSNVLNDSVSQNRYGIKDFVQSGGARTKGEADALAARLLKERAKAPSATALTLATNTARETACSISINCIGLYETLGWAITANSSTSQSETTTQAVTLLAATPNAWITPGRITASSFNASQYIAPDTTYRAKIEELLELGMSSGVPLSWGVYNNKAFEIVPWAGVDVGSMPARRLVTSTQEPIVRNADGSEVPWWRVRPNYYYSSDLLSDGSAEGVVGRVSFSCSSEGMSLSLEGTDRSSADALIARVR